MSWIAEYDTQGREFPTCVHVTKTTGTMTHGATYVPIEDGKAVRAENTELRELVRDMWREHECCYLTWPAAIADRMRELGVEVNE